MIFSKGLIDKSTNKSTKHDKSNDMPISKNINLSKVKQVMMDNTPLQDKENRFEALNDFAPSIDEDMEDMFELDSDSSSQSFEFVDATQFHSNKDRDMVGIDKDVNTYMNMQFLK